MKASVIIPVWNGATVISDCLKSLFEYSTDELLEVICVDNASQDSSATQISRAYPSIHLIQQPVNLGFAGGVNAGINAASGDVLILVNQDCVVEPGWLTKLKEALDANPQYGIIGCTILNADGSINHTGAAVTRPSAEGIHITTTGTAPLIPVEFVTGAAMAIRRQTLQTIGLMDTGFYPAYYEDADYCYRARNKGIETACTTVANVVHLFSSQAWKSDPIRHTTNGYIARYRFICKHFSDQEFSGFHEAEIQALENENFLDHSIGRFIAARHTLHMLPQILIRRQEDLNSTLTKTEVRHLQYIFNEITQYSFRKAENLILSPFTELDNSSNTPREMALNEWNKNWQSNGANLEKLRIAENNLLQKMYFATPAELENEKTSQRIYRLLFKRLPSLLSGRDKRLQDRLNAIYQHRAAALAVKTDLAAQLSHQTSERLKLLEQLLEYDYRYQ